MPSARHGDGTGPRDRRDRHGYQGLDGPRACCARGAQVSLHPCTQHRRGAARRAPRRNLPLKRPRRPGRARARCRNSARARRRSGPSGASASATSCSAAPSAWRPSSSPLAIAAPTTPSRTCRPGALRSPPRTMASPRSRQAARAPSTPTSPCAGRPISAPPQLSHVNLYDRTVEGLELLDVPGGTVQYHPEAGPGPHDCSTSSTGSWSALPRREDIHKILILGSGPIVIGQAAEFDYSGVQACKVLREEGYRGRARQLQPRHDHDRPRVRRRDLHRAAAARARRPGDRARAPRRAARRRSAGRPRSTSPRRSTTTARSSASASS